MKEKRWVGKDIEKATEIALNGDESNGNRYYYLFSKSGFTNELMDQSNELNIVLVDLDSIYN